MLEAIVTYFSGSLGKLELVATILLIINVALLGRQRLSNFFFGLAGVILFGFLFEAYKLYSDMLLQWVFYAPLQIVGFVMWKYGRTLGSPTASAQLDSMQVVWLRPRAWPFLLLAIVVIAAALGGYMAHNTDASFPYADALTTSLSLVASVLMLKKIIENWVLWIIMDLIAIPIYFLKGLYVTSGLYVIFLVLAIMGLVQWVRDHHATAADPVADAS